MNRLASLIALLCVGCLQLPPLPRVADMTTDAAPFDTNTDDTSIGADAESDHGMDAGVLDVSPDADAGVDEVSLACGPQHACVIRSGRLSCWGNNSSSQIDVGGGTRDTPSSTAIDDELVRDVSLGATHTCAVMEDGLTVKCWGTNNFGQVHPTESPTTGVAVVAFASESAITTLAAGEQHTCVSGQPGTQPGLYCWGGDFTDLELHLPPLESISAYDATCAITRANDEISCWGENMTLAGLPNNGITKPPFATPPTFVAIDVGGLHACALDDAGRAWCFGNDTQGQQNPEEPDTETDVPPEIVRTNVSDVAVGASHTCIIDSEGVARCWGRNLLGETGTPGDGSTGSAAAPDQRSFVQACAGLNYTCAVDDLARVYCWGDLATLLGEQNTNEPFQIPLD